MPLKRTTEIRSTSMDLRQLHYFDVLADVLNFRRAAEQLNIVQPALSMQIRNLEEDLGARLFKRTSRGVELTSFGQVFREQASRVLAQTAHAREVMQEVKAGRRGLLRIGFVGNAAVAGKVAEDVRRFHTERPEVALRVHEMTPASQAEHILKGQLDLGYVPVFGSAFEYELRCDRLNTWQWLIAMSEDHKFCATQSISAEHLRDKDFILYARDAQDLGQYMTLHRLLGREPKIVSRSGNLLSLLTLVAAGVGVALVPSPMANVTLPRLVFRDLEGFDERTELVMLSRPEEVDAHVLRYRACSLRDLSGQNADQKN